MDQYEFWSMLVFSFVAVCVVGYSSRRYDAALLAGCYVILIYIALFTSRIAVALRRLFELFSGEKAARPEFAGTLERLRRTARELGQ